MEREVPLPLSALASLIVPKRTTRFSHELAACVLLAVVAFAWPAQGNGRFPRAQKLIVDPNDSAHLILVGTYGLLLTEDRGATWHHVCEASFGEPDLRVDALAALTSDGALLAGIFSGVALARESACDFERTLGLTNRRSVPDFALAASEPGLVFAIEVSLLESGSTENRLYRSQDDGRSWSAVGELLPASLQTVLTLDVAPSDPERIYVSGLGPDFAGVLLRSDDGGESFDSFEIPTNGSVDDLPFIAAVAPNNPDELYVRTDRWSYDPKQEVTHAGDALLYSNDGGGSFSELIRAGGKLYGFSLSPDGEQVLVGYGDPKEAAQVRQVDPEQLGIYRAPRGSADFTRLYPGGVNCLTWTDDDLYVCTDESDAEFSLSLISDLDFDLDTPPKFEPLLRLEDVAGPLECPACTSSAVCPGSWFATCQSWGREDCVNLDRTECTADGGAAGQDAGAEAGSGGSRAEARGASDEDAGTRGDEDSSRNDASRSNCACRTAGGSSAPPGDSSSLPGAWLLLAGLLAAARRRVDFGAARWT